LSRFSYFKKVMHQDSIKSFQEKLDIEYQWPSLYAFKFIVPKGKEAAIKEIFVQHDAVEKASSKGNYISITIKIMAPSSNTVIDYYLKASKIEGVIAL
jgi:putative lipoic acid-binding regulatory protein